MAYITVAELKEYLDYEDTETFLPAAVSVAGDTITLASVRYVNNLTTGKEVTLTSSEAVADLPAPLAEDTVYYVILDADQDIQLATTSANATAGTNITLTDGGTGTHTIALADNDDTILEDCISRAQAAIDARCGRTFEASTETRYYDRSALGGRGFTLYVDEDLLTITTLTNGDSAGTVIAGTEFWLIPRNETPHYAVRLKSESASSWEFDTDYWVSILGTWGYSATAPDDIQQACARWAAYLYRQRDTGQFDTVAVGEGGRLYVPRGVPEGVNAMLEPYVRRGLA